MILNKCDPNLDTLFGIEVFVELYAYTPFLIMLLLNVLLFFNALITLQILFHQFFEVYKS